MKPLIVLIAVYIICIIFIKVAINQFDFALSAKIAMSVMLVFTAIGHFVFSKGMALMIPEFIPYKKELVYITGILEIAAAIGLLVPRFSLLTAWLLIVFFVVLIPANINAAVKQLNIEKGTYDGTGTRYLWFRIPLQLFFIIWVYLAAII